MGPYHFRPPAPFLSPQTQDRGLSGEYPVWAGTPIPELPMAYPLRCRTETLGWNNPSQAIGGLLTPGMTRA